jgi:hypothetical protein
VGGSGELGETIKHLSFAIIYYAGWMLDDKVFGFLKTRLLGAY